MDKEKAYWSIQTWIILWTILIYLILYNPVILITGWLLFVFNAIRRKKDQDQNPDNDQNPDQEIDKINDPVIKTE